MWLRLCNPVTSRCLVKAGFTDKRKAADVGSRQYVAAVTLWGIGRLKMDVPAAGDAIDGTDVIQWLAADMAGSLHDRLLSVSTL